MCFEASRIKETEGHGSQADCDACNLTISSMQHLHDVNATRATAAALLDYSIHWYHYNSNA